VRRAASLGVRAVLLGINVPGFTRRGPVPPQPCERAAENLLMKIANECGFPLGLTRQSPVSLAGRRPYGSTGVKLAMGDVTPRRRGITG